MILEVDSVAGQNFVVLAAPVSTVVATDTQTILNYMDVRGFSTDLVFEAGTVSETTAVTVTPILLPGATETVFAGHGFDVTAVQGGGGLSVFDNPVKITILYSDVDIRFVTAEEELLLMWWDGAGWIDAAETCSPTSVNTRNLSLNSIRVEVCRYGRYGLFGPSSRMWLPIMR
jgi:hypothetical protein